MHFDGNVIDVYGTVFSGGVLSSSIYKFGGGAVNVASVSLDSNPIGNSKFNFGTGDFTIECWFYVDSSSVLNFNILNPSGGNSLGFSVINSGPACVCVLNTNAYYQNITSAPSTWNSFALVRASNKIYFFLNGNIVGTPQTGANENINPTSAGQIQIGLGGGAQAYMDELRISNAALYTSNYTPANSEFTA